METNSHKKVAASMALRCLLVCIHLTSYLRTVSPALIYTSTPKLIGSYKRSVTLEFFTNFTSDGTAFKSLVVETPNGEVATGGKSSFIVDTPNQFGERLTAKPRVPPYVLIINQLIFNDDTTFIGRVFYMLNDATVKMESATVDLTILGGPILCGTNLDATTNFTDQASNLVTITLCGRPKPTVSWKLDSEVLTSNGTGILVGKSNYTFSFQFNNTNSSMCGKTLRYEAVGHGTPISGETKLNTNIKPTVASIYSYQTNSSCLRTEWTALDIGRCRGLEYQIEYLSVTGDVIYSATASQSDTNLTYCRAGNMVISLTRVRGMFNGQVGEWSEAANKSRSQTNDNNNKEVIIAAVCGTVGIILVIVIIWVVVYCCCCKEKKEESGVSKTDSFGYHPKKKSKKEKKNNSQRNNGALNEVRMQRTDNNDIKFFDPQEFGLEEKDSPKKSKVMYENPSFNGDDEFTNKPTFLI